MILSDIEKKLNIDERKYINKIRKKKPVTRNKLQYLSYISH